MGLNECSQNQSSCSFSESLRYPRSKMTNILCCCLCVDVRFYFIFINVICYLTSVLPVDVSQYNSEALWKWYHQLRKMSSPDWPVSKPVVHFLDWLLIWTAPQMGNMGHGRQIIESNPVSTILQWPLLKVLPPGSYLYFLPWIPSVMNCDLEEEVK